VKKKLLITISFIAAILLMCGTLVIVVDPFFHFHGPLEGLEYPLKDERYINDGIQRHYEYEVMITGTSMSQNMRLSLVESLTGKEAVKTCYSSASFFELSRSMLRAIGYNPNLREIISSLDPSMMQTSPTEVSYEGIPDYLYDNNIFNDINYIFNKDVILKTIAVLNYTRSGQTTTNLDDYGRYDIYHSFGKESILQTFTRAEKAENSEDVSTMGNDYTAKATENVFENYITLARENPDVTFKFFIPPYSVYYWDNLDRKGTLYSTIEVEEHVVSLLLREPNIEVYAFDDLYDITNNPDKYMDMLHYDGDTADIILESILMGEHRLLPGEVSSYFEAVRNHYKDINFDEFF